MDYQQRRRAQGQATEQRLIEAGRRLMLQHGYEEVSIRDICREAGVTTGAFYHHFSSKEQMLEMGGQQLDLYIQQQLRTRPHHSSLSALRLLFTAYAEYIEQNQGELTARYYQNMLAVSGKRPFDMGRTIYQMVHHYVEQALERGVLSPEFSADTIVTFSVRHFRGIVIDWAFHNYSFSLMEAMQQEFRLLYRLFRGPRAPKQLPMRARARSHDG